MRERKKNALNTEKQLKAFWSSMKEVEQRRMKMPGATCSYDLTG